MALPICFPLPPHEKAVGMNTKGDAFSCIWRFFVA
jgi:hypothetical protein